MPFDSAVFGDFSPVDYGVVFEISFPDFALLGDVGAFAMFFAL
jgi:hypothetical protein